MTVEIKAVCDECRSPAANGLFIHSAFGWATIRDAADAIEEHITAKYRIASQEEEKKKYEPIGPEKEKRDFCSPECFVRYVNERVVATWAARLGRPAPKVIEGEANRGDGDRGVAGQAVPGGPRRDREVR